MGTETFQSPEIGTLVYKIVTEQQLTKILLNEEEELVEVEYCENYLENLLTSLVSTP